ncbi:MAG TPA: hypothetical protein VGL86_28465 [Polyangia bacterium]
MRHTLRFSLRRDADDLTLDEIRQRVERAMGCSLSPGGERYNMFLFQGSILGMEILLGEWHGIEDRRTFQLHGGTPAPMDGGSEDYSVTSIDEVVIDLLAVRDAGAWRVPSDEEVIAESEYGARREQEEMAQAAADHEDSDRNE